MDKIASAVLALKADLKIASPVLTIKAQNITDMSLYTDCPPNIQSDFQHQFLLNLSIYPKLVICISAKTPSDLIQ